MSEIEDKIIGDLCAILLEKLDDQQAKMKKEFDDFSKDITELTRLILILTDNDKAL